MSTAAPETSADRLPPTDVRFSVRALLILMLCVAIVAAVFGFVLRSLPLAARAPAVGSLVVVGLVLIACAAYAARERRSVERLAGTPRFTFTPHSYLFPGAPRIAARLAGAIAMLYGVGYLLGIGALAWESNRLPAIGTILSHLAYSVMAISFGIGALWWNRDVRLSDDGVLLSNQLIPWSDHQRHYWDACRRDAMVLEWQKHGRTAFCVPTEDRDAVAAYVNERITTAKAPPVSATTSP